MALDRGNLCNVVQVAGGTTVGIITCASNKKVYVKSVIMHASGAGISTGTAQVYFCPSGITSAHTNRIFDVDILAGETIMFEPSYPLVLEATGDSIQVGTGHYAGAVALAATTVNFIITGDKEA